PRRNRRRRQPVARSPTSCRPSPECPGGWKRSCSEPDCWQRPHTRPNPSSSSPAAGGSGATSQPSDASEERLPRLTQAPAERGSSQVLPGSVHQLEGLVDLVAGELAVALDGG